MKTLIIYSTCEDAARFAIVDGDFSALDKEDLADLPEEKEAMGAALSELLGDEDDYLGKLSLDFPMEQIKLEKDLTFANVWMTF